MEQLEDIESKIAMDEEVANSLTVNLSLIGGETLESNVRRVMAHTLTQQVAVNFNWIGKGSRKAFEKLLLKKAITDAVRTSKAGTDNMSIEKIMKEWDREGGRKKRRDKQLEKERMGESDTDK